MRQSHQQHFLTLYRPMVYSRADLRAQGMTPLRIANAVRAGALIRIRRDRYASANLDAHVHEAVRIGGRLSCLSVLQQLGVFVHRSRGLHVHIVRGGSRLRTPRARSTTLHWHPAIEQAELLHVASLIDVVRHAVRCQEPRAALATLDSLLFLGFMTREDLIEVFDTVPRRFRSLLALADGSAESGPETFVRLILRTLGVPFETQVRIPGVGRVDFMVDGWLIIECDSRAFHAGWEQQVADRRRDLAAARLGYTTVRPLAADIMDHPDRLRLTLIDILDARAAVR